MKKFFTMICLLSAVAFGQYGGGDGTSGNPYQISTPAHLHAVRDNLSAYFIQTANIDLTAATSSGGDYYNGGSGWEPIGTNSSKFLGSYDGDGYTITGMMINRPSTYYIGLFGNVGNGSASPALTDIRLVSVNVTGSGETGALIGRGEKVTISGCSSTGTVSNGGGGFIGGLGGSIIGASVITQSYTTCTVSSTGHQVGGFVGYADVGPQITNSYARGSVTTTATTVGGFGGQYRSTTSVTNCYSTGVPSGTSNVGGFIGVLFASTATNCFWDTETSGTGSSSGGTGKTTAQMKTGSTFTTAGWSNSIWYLDAEINDGYPYLAWQNPSGSPLPVELQAFSASVSGEYIKLTWMTATEVNNYGFEIERSLNMTEWEKITFVAGGGNTNAPRAYSYKDAFISNQTVYYRLKQIDNDGTFSYSPVAEVSGKGNMNFSLDQNFPNPFNPETMIRFTLAVPSVVSLKVFTVTGEEVMSVLENVSLAAGSHLYNVDASRLNSGVYIYTISDGSKTLSRKMNFLK